VTVLFCDVTGSTALGERRDPEQLRRVLSQYAREARAVVKRHGGMVEKFIGDAVMALFGLPAVHEDDALRAARAALELRANLAELNETLAREMGIEIRTRIGINSGEVVSGDPGGGDGFVTGDPVNVAKRLEEAAEPGEILIGEETYQLARDALQVEELAPLSLKGKQESIQAYRLVGVTPGALPRVRRSDTPMVGREDELALLQDAFARAVSGRACHLFTVRGSAGVGKSRLVEEALARLDGDALVLRGACLPYGEGITFWPVLEIVQQATGVTKEDPPERARAKIAAVLGHADESAPVLAERIAELIGMAEAGGSAEEGFWAVRKLLEALGQRQALVLVLDDLNWAEPMLLDLVEHVAEWARDAPILLVCLARPELIDLRPGWGGGKPNTTSIFLEPLSETESLRLIENLVGSVLPADVRARIQEAAAGNPLFVEEMVAMLVDEGRLLREDGHWVVRGDLSDLSVPPSIKVLIASRLDQLGADERRMLERAAVEGNVFHRGAVAALAVDVEPAAVDRHLQALVRKELVRLHRSAFPGEEGFCFRHPLIREATYESLPKETRSRLHQELAAWLEGAARDRRTEHDELLGYHLEQAFHYRTELRPGDDAARPLAAAAADRLGAAGQRALARGDAPAAASLLDRAASLVSADTAAHAHLVLDLGRALAESGTFDLAEGALERAIDAARASGDEALEARAQTWQLRVGVQRGMPVEQCLSEARNAAAVLERLGDSLGVAEALTFAGTLELWLGRGAKAVELLELAAVHAQRAGARREEVDALNWLVLGLLFGPTPAGDAIARCAEISERAADAPRLEAFASVGRGGLEAMQGRLDDARRMVAHGRAMLQDLGAAVEWAAAGQVAGWIELLAGDEGAAEGQLRPAYELLDQIGEAGFRSTIAAHLAEALFRQRRDEEALQLTRVGEEAAAPDDFESQAAWRMVRAKLCARQGAADEAEGFARSAVEIAQRTDYPALIGRAQLALAEVLDAAKRGAEAAAVRAEAVRQFELKGDLVMASAARRAGVGSPVA
jgi:class 3 adenylate cyclase/tetratricopeptide (TPR) repeat protein